jgi:hypothetical protein
MKRERREPRPYFVKDEVMREGLEVLGAYLYGTRSFNVDGLYETKEGLTQRDEPAPLRFARSFSLNPGVYECFSQHSKKMEDEGFDHYGAQPIIEYMRHHTYLSMSVDQPTYIDLYGEEKEGNPYKFSSDMTTYFARVYMCENPGEIESRVSYNVDNPDDCIGRTKSEFRVPHRLFELHTIQYELEFDEWLSWMYSVPDFRSRPEVSKETVLCNQRKKAY